MACVSNCIKCDYLFYDITIDYVMATPEAEAGVPFLTETRLTASSLLPGPFTVYVCIWDVGYNQCLANNSFTVNPGTSYYQYFDCTIQETTTFGIRISSVAPGYELGCEDYKTFTVNLVQYLNSISIPSSLSLNINETKQVNATCKDSNNNTITCPQLNFGINNAAVADIEAIDPDTVNVRGVSAGTATLTASGNGKTSNACNVTVTPSSCTNPKYKCSGTSCVSDNCDGSGTYTSCSPNPCSSGGGTGTCNDPLDIGCTSGIPNTYLGAGLFMFMFMMMSSGGRRR